jgi:hypothetical protein
MKTTPELYCQFLTSSQINYTCTYLADHQELLSHDSITRFLASNELQPNLIWEKVKELCQFSDHGYIIFDDSVVDKNYSSKIELVRKQWSGNEHRVIRGIGLVGCLYYNPQIDEYWLLDFRIYDPDADGKKKTEHVLDMLDLLQERRVIYQKVLFDAAYASKQILNKIHTYGKYFYCNIKKNHRACVIEQEAKDCNYQAVENLVIPHTGVSIRLNKLSPSIILTLFRSQVSTNRTDYLVTNDRSMIDLEQIEKENSRRWMIEQFHREIKQVTGIESCQCRKNRSQRNHICCSLMVWICFKTNYYWTKTTIYQLKQKLLDDYLTKELNNPSFRFEW